MGVGIVLQPKAVAVEAGVVNVAVATENGSNGLVGIGGRIGGG